MSLKVDYFARETANNLTRNVFMTTAAIVVVAVSLALVGGALLLKQGVDKATIQWKGGVELSVFMKSDAAPQEIQAVDSELRQTPEAKKVRYVDKQGAYDEFRKMFSNSPDMLETLSVDQMPPSFRVVPRQAAQVDVIGSRFKDQPGVRDVVYAKDTVKALLSVTRYAQLLIWSVAAVLLAAAALLILNTIRMAIYARRREVAVMKLVGATNWFIRVPFMFEGLVQGLIGALGAFAVVFLVRNFAQHAVRHVELFHEFAVSTNEVIGTGIFLVVVGMLVGAVGSAIAVSRFLDV
ncbi:MAG: ABC transporter permease [Acidimicrobiia bacterium]|nr:ABC transporter permease [Acidimicrobiia bacterium]